jgi:hypothetical protein
MRNTLFICSLLICFTAFAQHPEKGRQRQGKPNVERPDYSPEQIAELKTKKLTLMLDLSEAQQKKISQLELEAAKSRKSMMEGRERGEKPSNEERFNKQSEMLDRQIAHKKSMKSILNKEQFEKWEKSVTAKGKRRKGQRRQGGKGERRG